MVQWEAKMTTFTGSIARLATVKPIYALGSYPELLVDFYIQAHDLSWFETEWHAYLLTLDPASNQIAQAFRSDFNPPLFGNWPNPDTRVVTNAKIPLVVPLPPEGLNVAVQLYGSTTVWQPEGFIEQKVLLIAPGIPTPPPPEEEKEEKTNWTPLLIGGGFLFLAIAVGSTRKKEGT
jgi:hypothetical protein